MLPWHKTLKEIRTMSKKKPQANEPRIDVAETIKPLYKLRIYDKHEETLDVVVDLNALGLESDFVYLQGSDVVDDLNDLKKLYKASKPQLVGSFKDNASWSYVSLIPDADYIFDDSFYLKDTINLTEMFAKLNEVVDENKGKYNRIELQGIGDGWDFGCAWLPRIVGIRAENDDEYLTRIERMQKEWEEEQKKKAARKVSDKKKKIKQVEKLKKELAKLQKEIDS